MTSLLRGEWCDDTCTLCGEASFGASRSAAIEEQDRHGDELQQRRASGPTHEVLKVCQVEERNRGDHDGEELHSHRGNANGTCFTATQAKRAHFFGEISNSAAKSFASAAWLYCAS
jgi:hypothetical protein